MRTLTIGTCMAAAAIGVAGPLATAVGAQAAQDPGGNNGTVKIDGVPFDAGTNNEPHVGCVFNVDFFGYDAGDLSARVSFSVQPPTGRPVELLTDTVFIGEDAAGGGTDIDAAATYDLSSSLSAYSPHPQQGYHIKLTVNAQGAKGADVKHKVFWVQNCGDSSGDDGNPNT